MCKRLLPLHIATQRQSEVILTFLFMLVDFLERLLEGEFSEDRLFFRFIHAILDWDSRLAADCGQSLVILLQRNYPNLVEAWIARETAMILSEFWASPNLSSQFEEDFATLLRCIAGAAQRPAVQFFLDSFVREIEALALEHSGLFGGRYFLLWSIAIKLIEEWRYDEFLFTDPSISDFLEKFTLAHAIDFLVSNWRASLKSPTKESVLSVLSDLEETIQAIDSLSLSSQLVPVVSQLSDQLLVDEIFLSFGWRGSIFRGICDALKFKVSTTIDLPLPAARALLQLSEEYSQSPPKDFNKNEIFMKILSLGFPRATLTDSIYFSLRDKIRSF